MSVTTYKNNNTTQDICYNRLINLHQPGGESTILNEAELSNKIEVTITKGGLYNENTIVSGIITNLNLNSTAVFQPDCFQYGCFEGSGLWTTAATSSVIQVVNGITQYWIEGSTDSNGNLWVLDIGYVYPITGEITIQDYSVAINNDGTFQGTQNIYPYIKVLTLVELTSTTSTPILNYFGEFPPGSHISRSSVGYILNYNATDQLTELEDLSIGLLTLLFSSYKNAIPNQTIFSMNGDIDLGIQKIINDNIFNLTNLLDFTSTSNRQYSIPKYLTTYLTPSLLYNDSLYLDNIIRCFEPDCFEETPELCFEEYASNLTSSREVSTRAIAWFYILVYSYTIYLKDQTYLYILGLLAQYLLNQIDPSTKLPFQGWTHNNILIDSVEIEEYDISTATITYIALLKHYEYNQNIIYLEAATNIREAIYTNLFNFKQKTFEESLSNNNVTVNSYTYGLLFSLLDNRIDVAENIISTINQYLTVDYGIIKQNLVNGNITYINKLENNYLLANPTAINFTTLSYSSSSLIDLTKENTLLYFILDLTSDYSIYLPPSITNTLNYFIQAINIAESTNSLINTIYCFENNNPFKLEVLRTNIYLSSFSLSYERVSLLQSIQAYIPLNYGWFSSKAMSPLGNLFKLINTVAIGMSSFITHTKYLFSQLNMNNTSGFNLDYITQKFSFVRLNQESDNSYLSFIKGYINGNDISNTKIGLQNTLNRLGINYSISELYNKIFILNTITEGYSLNLGEGIYSGENIASTNIIKVDLLNPLNDVIASEIINNLPIATIPIVNEIISIEEDLELGSCLNYTETISAPPPTYFILQEEDTNDTSYITQEDGISKINTELAS